MNPEKLRKLNDKEVKILLCSYQDNALAKLQNYHRGMLLSKRWERVSKQAIICKLEHILSAAKKKTYEEITGKPYPERKDPIKRLNYEMMLKSQTKGKPFSSVKPSGISKLKCIQVS